MFSFVSILQKIALWGACGACAAVTAVMGAQLNSTYREFRHLQQLEQQRSRQLEQQRHLWQQQESHLQHLLTDGEFLEHVVQQHMGGLQDDEVLFRFENAPEITR